MVEQGVGQGMMGGPRMRGLLWPLLNKPLGCELEPCACCFRAPGCLRPPYVRAGGFDRPGG